MDRLLTLKETGKLLNVSKQTLQRWDNSGKLIAVRTEGGHRRYKLSDIEKILGCVESGDKKLFEAANDFETMYNESERVYNKDYSTGEYCHEQSFKWGFQEGFDFAMKLIKGEQIDINNIIYDNTE